jgi:Rhs element Vgr protein
MGLSPSPTKEKTLHYRGEAGVLVKHKGEELERVDVRNMVIDHEVGRVSYATLLFNPGRIERHGGVQGEPEEVVGRFKAGDKIELFAVKRGAAAPVPLFEGEVTKVKLQATASGASLQVEARARCHRMTMGRRTVAYASKVETEVFKELAERSGVDLRIQKSLQSRVTTVQHNSSDWDFMQLRLEAICCCSLPRLDHLLIAEIAEPSTPDYKFELGENILEFESEMDAAEQFQTIETSSWNDESREFETARMDALSSTAVEGIGKDSLTHGGGRPYDEIYDWARSEMIKRRLAEYRSNVRVYGSEIWPGESAELSGLGEGFSGIKFVSGVRHEINRATWTTHVQLGVDPTTFRSRHPEVTGPESSGLLPGVQGLQIGIVRGLQNDPDGMHRIEVSLVAAGDNDGRIWARLATFQASKETGAFFLPNIDDEVVIGFLNGDPRDAIVLGSLYSQAHKPPLKMTDENTERGYVSAKKSRIVFDEQFSSIEISVGDEKNFIYLEGGDNPGIDIEDQFGNHIKMSDQGIVMQSDLKISISSTTDIEIKGTNVKISADAQLQLSGNAGAELKSSANTVIKGALVQIN